MTLNATLTGQLQTGPASVTDNSQFPSEADSILFGLTPLAFPYNVKASNTLNLNSPSAFVTLPGVGGVGPVTQCKFLLARSNNPVQLRLTFSGDATPKVTYFTGVFLLQVDPGHLITLVEAEGSATLEYWACGDQ